MKRDQWQSIFGDLNETQVTTGAVIASFQRALGADNAKMDYAGILLTFNSDLQILTKFNQFSELAMKNGIEFHPFIPSKSTSNMITLPADDDRRAQILIPLKGREGSAERDVELNLLYGIAIRMKARVTDTGEIHEPIMPGEPAHVLEQATGISWCRVKRSVYGNDVVEPRLGGMMEDPARTNAEFGIGYALIPPEGAKTVTGQVGDWLNHQRKVEKEGVQPRVALPEEWVNGTRIERADFTRTGNLTRLFRRNDSNDKEPGRG